MRTYSDSSAHSLAYGRSIQPSAHLLLQTLRPAPPAGGQQALGWEVLPASEGDYASKTESPQANARVRFSIWPAAWEVWGVPRPNPFP
jgi:hypothetical protein